MERVCYGKWKDFEYMKRRLTLSIVLTLVLLGILTVLLSQGDQKEAERDSGQEELLPLAEDRVLEMRPSPVSRPNLRELSYEEQLAVLTREGWSPEEARVYAFGRLLHALEKLADGYHEGDYWEAQAHQLVNWEQRRQSAENQRLMEEVLGDLIGKPGLSFDGPVVPLPEEKRKAVLLMEQDYELMEGKLHHESRGILFPEDREALALLTKARRKDIEALLSPEELFEYDLRKSDIARSLRGQLSAFEPTKEEFREIFRIQQEESRLAESDSSMDDEALAQRQAEAGDVMETELRDLLGERYQLYERSQDWSYGRLIAVTERLDIPRERVDVVYDLKDLLESEKAALQENAKLSPEARNEAVRELEEEVRVGVTELLGEDGFEVYRDNGGNWLQEMQGEFARD